MPLNFKDAIDYKMDFSELKKNGELFSNLSFRLPRSPEVTLTFDLQLIEQQQISSKAVDP